MHAQIAQETKISHMRIITVAHDACTSQNPVTNNVKQSIYQFILLDLFPAMNSYSKNHDWNVLKFQEISRKMPRGRVEGKFQES